MNKRIKRAWIKALRSGEYEQGRFELCDADSKMCCLGVLCDIAIHGDWEWSSEFTSWLPPKSVASGITHWSKPGYESVGLTWDDANRLSTMNDRGKSFCEIADWIEENL